MGDGRDFREDLRQMKKMLSEAVFIDNEKNTIYRSMPILRKNPRATSFTSPNARTVVSLLKAWRRVPRCSRK